MQLFGIKMRNSKIMKFILRGAFRPAFFQFFLRRYEGWNIFFRTLDGGSRGWKKAAGWLPAPGWAGPPPPEGGVGSAFRKALGEKGLSKRLLAEKRLLAKRS